MSILSLEFFIFIAIILISYYVLPSGVRWLALLIGSAFFAFSGGWQSILHLSAIAILNWLGGLALEKISHKRCLLMILLIVEFGAMLVFKYDSSLLVPVGLSYFTFQSAGLLIDIYRGKVKAEKNPCKVWLFTGYFLQLVQGPISSWEDIGTQLTAGKSFEPKMFVSGVLFMLWGYFKKMVIADRLASVTNAVLEDAGALPGWLVLFCVVMYAIRLYTDFSGGMDVVRGISRMLGIELPENFRRPFFAQSTADYWRRWHITLGEWFRNYLLYPLTVSKKGIAFGKAASKIFGKKTGRAMPTAVATVLVFTLVGVWHGFYWNALIYGAYFGLVMAISILLDPIWKKWNRRWNLKEKKWMYPVRLLRTWGILLPAQFFAFTESPMQSLSLMKQCLQNWHIKNAGIYMTDIMTVLEWGILGTALVILLVVDIFSERGVVLGDRLAEEEGWNTKSVLAGEKSCTWKRALWMLLRWLVLWGLLLAVLIFGVYGPSGDSSAFLYTQF